MEYFKLNKFQLKYENPLFLSKEIYYLLKTPKTLDQLIRSLGKQLDTNLTVELESTIFLSLLFLYSNGIIDSQNDKIVRIEK